MAELLPRKMANLEMPALFFASSFFVLLLSYHSHFQFLIMQRLGIDCFAARYPSVALVNPVAQGAFL